MGNTEHLEAGVSGATLPNGAIIEHICWYQVISLVLVLLTSLSRGLPMRNGSHVYSRECGSDDARLAT